MNNQIYIGTSGWHYADWTKLFYPPDVTGYHELTYHAQFFNSVENNSSFYRIAGESTYKTWGNMTPDEYTFSMKLNKFITHTSKLEQTDEVQQKIQFILDTTQVLGNKLGAILIQLPPSFKYDLPRVDKFLNYFTAAVRAKPHPFDIAIEFRNKYWFRDELYEVLKRYNVALVDGQSSRWPEMRQVTASIAYIRMHGPEKLFASSYTDKQLEELSVYIRKLPTGVKRVYVYFNNDFHGYAIANARKLIELLGLKHRSA